MTAHPDKTTSESAIAHLAASDPVMAEQIDRWGPLTLQATDDYFVTLVEAIASQQLSSKAADTIIRRLNALVPREGKLEPESVLALPDQALRDAGLSWSKVCYLKDLASRIVSVQLDLAHI